MKQASLDQLLQQLQALGAESREVQLAFASKIRARFQAAPDTVLKARYFYLSARLLAVGESTSVVVDELLQAYRIFGANARPAEQAACLPPLCFWYFHHGHSSCALFVAQTALRHEHISAEDRLRLLPPLCEVLAGQWRLPAAWATMREVGEPLLRQVSGGTARGMGLMAYAVLHLYEALRARRIPALSTLDLAPGEPDTALYEQHLRGMRSRLDQVRVVTQDVFVNGMEALYAALCGDAAQVRRRLAPPTADLVDLVETARLYNLGWCERVLGHPGRALHLHEQAMQRAGAQQLSQGLKLIHFDRSQCAQMLGRSTLALQAMGQYLHLVARDRAADEDAAVTLHAVLDMPAAAKAAVGTTTATPARPPRQQTEPPYLLRAQRHVLTQLPKRVSPAALADVCKVSLRSLQVAVQRYRGQTVTALIRETLIEDARRMLLQTPMSIADIARHLGYPDQTGFSRDARRVLGMAPSAYRQLHAKTKRNQKPF